MATQLAEMPGGLGGGEVAEQGSEAQTQPQERDYEAEARQQGWTPQEDFKGDVSRWVDAETFVKRADEVMPLLKKQNQSLKRDIEDLKKTIRKLEKAEQRAYESARSDLERDMEAAVEAGDMTAFRAVKEKVDKLDKEVREDVTQQSGNADAESALDDFREANPWYDRGGLAAASELEVDARAYADRIADRYARQGTHKDMAPADWFQMIADEVNAKYPQLSQKTQRQKPASDVAGVTPRVAPKGAKTGANLPPDAKKQAERFFNQGIIKGKTLSEALDNYAKSYQW